MTSDAQRIERAIMDAKSGRIGTEAMLDILLDGDLVIPSGAAVEGDGSGFQPVLFDKQGTPMISTFTATEGIGKLAKLAPYALRMSARTVLARIPAGHGVVINPGQEVGFEIDPEGLARLMAGRASSEKA